MDVFGDRADVLFGQRHGRHPAAVRRRAAVLDDRPHQLALEVAQDELRPQQVGPAEIAAAQVDAVAGAAVDAVNRLAAGDQLGIAGRALQRRVEPLAAGLRRLFAGSAAGCRSCGLAAGRCMSCTPSRSDGRCQEQDADPARLPTRSLHPGDYGPVAVRVKAGVKPRRYASDTIIGMRRSGVCATPHEEQGG